MSVTLAKLGRVRDDVSLDDPAPARPVRHDRMGPHLLQQVGRAWRTNARLLSSVSRRYVYLALWVPNGLIVGCESLVFLTHPGFCLACIACAAASVGYSASLMLQQRSMALTPEEPAAIGVGLGAAAAALIQRDPKPEPGIKASGDELTQPLPDAMPKT